MKPHNNSGPAPRPEKQAAPPPLPGLYVSRPLAFALISLAVLPWIVVVWVFSAFLRVGLRPGTEGAEVRAAEDPAVIIGRDGDMKPAAAKVVCGPWGTLQINPVVVEPPSSFFSFDYNVDPSRRWRFRSGDPGQARSLLLNAGLEGQVVETIMKTATPAAEGGGLVLAPPDDVLSAIKPEVRAALYAELGRNPANALQAKPFKFRGASVHEWFANSGLGVDIMQKIIPLVYRRGSVLYFSDLHLILPGIDSPLDRVRLLRTLSRAATYSLRLRIRENEPVESMLAYWDNNNRYDEIEPVLKSIQGQPGGGLLDVVYLLPDFARTRLYTYVNPTRGDPSVVRDCHWTSFNFFNDLPDDRFGRGTDLTELTVNDYKQVQSPTEFGDLVLFVTHEKGLIHSCVYIADDIVFTKNGIGFGTPFIFEKMGEVINTFRTEVGDFSVKYCRRRLKAD
ncbi:MAG: hypothetical protein WC299_14105 [Kiritimatiellia bacterium]